MEKKVGLCNPNCSDISVVNSDTAIDEHMHTIVFGSMLKSVQGLKLKSKLNIRSHMLHDFTAQAGAPCAWNAKLSCSLKVCYLSCHTASRSTLGVRPSTRTWGSCNTQAHNTFNVCNRW